MSRLLDTSICPDCRGPLDPAVVCTVCGLRIAGPLAMQLWNAMVSADRAIEALRTASAVQPVTLPESAHAPLPPAAAPSAPAGPRSRRLPAASVPAVLLGLGALCLLVAAAVFVAVTWGLLGLTGRTLVLLGVTTVLSVVAVTLTRKALRAAAETLWLVVAGMLTLDLLGAQSAGLLGLDSLGWRGTGALVGGSLTTMGVLVALWARQQPLRRLYGAEAVAVAGAAVLCTTNVWFAANPAIASTIAIPLLGAALVVLRRPAPLAAYGMGGLGVVSWLALLATGWERALETTAPGTWWAELRGWPLLAAAVLGATAVYAPLLPQAGRAAVAAFSLLPLVLLANAPQSALMPTRELLIACATLVAIALLAALAPRPWARGAAALTALGLFFLGLWLVYGPWNVLIGLPSDGNADLRLSLSAPSDLAAPWTAVVAAAAALVAASCLLRRVPATHRPAATSVVRVLAPAVLALGALMLVLELEPPLWAGVLAAALATGVAGGAAWWSRDHGVAAPVGSSATAYLAVVTCDLALAAHLLTALTATAFFAGLLAVAVLRARVAAQPSTAIAAGLAALAGGWALTGWGHVMGADLTDRALVLAVYAGLVGVLAYPVARRTTTRLTLEGAAAALALVALLATISVALGSAGDRAMAMVLTVIGTALCIIAVSTWDRVFLGWAGAAVLGVATVLRVLAEVSAPELYTLPSALLLVGVGALRLRRDPGSSSFTVLGSGLTLALAPSLLLALEEPVTLRGALIGVAAVLVLAAGIQLRLAAPFVMGALTTAALALRHLQPVADAVPRWVSLGGVGVALLVVGVTWEARRSDLATAQRYLTALR